jgi:hypothetical protein
VTREKRREDENGESWDKKDKKNFGINNSFSQMKIVFSITSMKKRPGFSMCNI